MRTRITSRLSVVLLSTLFVSAVARTQTPLGPASRDAPAGGLVYEVSDADTIAPAFEVDDWTIDVEHDAAFGQTITVIVQSAVLRATVSLLDPTPAVIATATAGAVGDTVILQTAATTSAGTYTVRVTDGFGNVGAYAVTVILNAAAEEENWGGATNDDFASAQDINASFLSLGGGAERGAVLGRTSPGGIVTVFYEDFEAGLGGFTIDNTWGTAPLNGLWHLSTGRGADAGHSPVQSVYYGQGEGPAGGGDYDVGDTSGAVYSPGIALPASGPITLTFNYFLEHEGWNWDQASVAVDPGTGYVALLVSYPPLSNLPATGGVWVQATADLTPYAGSNVTLRFGFDTIDGAFNTFEGWYVDDVKIELALVQDPDFYAFDLAVGEAATVAAKALGAGAVGIEFYDGAGTPLATGTAGAANVDQVVENFVSPAADTYYVRVQGDFVDYSLVITRGSTFDVEPNDDLATAQDVGAGWTALGEVGVTDDYYSFPVNSGDSLDIGTSTPGDGAGEFPNTLDPAIELFNPSGVSVASDLDSAPDGWNALISSHVAADTGTYTVRVYAEANSGEYVLTVQGSTGSPPPFVVTSVDPADGAQYRLTGVPTQVTVDFSEPVLVLSLDAADLTVDGVAATGFTVVDADTVVFDVTVPAPLVGMHTVAIAAGVIDSFHGGSIEAFSSQFELLPPPKVISSSIPEAATVPAGDLTYTAQFDEQMDDTVLDAGDFALVGAAMGPCAPDTWSYDPPTSTLTIDYSGLLEDSFTLTLFSGDGQFEDVYGVDLDGSAPSFPLPSGDNVEGGDFSVNFVTDVTTLPYPTPLGPKNPAGSLVYDGSVTTLILPAADVDSYTIDLDAGQVMTVVVRPVPALRPEVEVFDPGAGSLGLASASAAGETIMLQTLPVAAAGTYTITVNGDGATSGACDVEVTLNAAVEEEPITGVANDGSATAEDIDLSSVSISASADRLAVLGDVGVGQEDWFSFTLADGETATVVLAELTGAGTILELWDDAANLLAVADTYDTNVALGVENFVNTAGSPATYYARVRGTAVCRYDLVVTRGATFDVEDNGTIDRAQDTGAGLQALGHVDDLPVDMDVCKFDVASGDSLTITTSTPGGEAGEFVNELDPFLELYDENGDLVAFDNDSADGRNAVINHTAASAGSYTALVSSVAGRGEYVVSVAGATGARPPFEVVDHTPADGARLPAPPATFTVVLSEMARVNTVDAADLTVVAVGPATGVNQTDGKTLVFTLPAIAIEGEYTVQIAVDAITGVGGQGIQPFSSTFWYDITAPKVTASSITEGDAVTLPSPGIFTYTATFEEDIDTSVLDAGDMTLVGARSGAHAPIGWDFDAAADTLTIEYLDLPEDDFTLTLVSGFLAFKDLAGNFLDGEPNWPLPSGDDAAGGNFFVNFTTDRADGPYPTPLEAKGPRGSLVYSDPSVATVIVPAADEDSFTIDLDAGRTMGVVVVPEAGFRPEVEVFDPMAGSLGLATASVPGEAILLQRLPVAGAGTYTITVNGDGATTGGCTVAVTLGTDIEEEEITGLTNDTLATAQSIEGGFVALPGASSGERGAVAGSAAIDDDWYGFDLAAGQIMTAAITEPAAGDFDLELHDSGGNLIASGTTAASNVREHITDFVADGTGTHYLRVSGDGGEYVLLVTREATFDIEGNDSLEGAQDLTRTGVVLGAVAGPGGPIAGETEPNDSIGTANVLAGGFVSTGEIPTTTYQAAVTGEIEAGSDADWDYFLLGASPGDVLTVELAGVTLLDPLVRLFDDAGTEIAADNDGGEDLYAQLVFDGFPYAGYYYVIADSYGITAGTYALTVTLETSSPIFTQGDFYSFEVNSGDALVITTATPSDGPGEFVNDLDPRVELLDPTGAVVAADDNSAPDLKNAVISHTAESTGTYTVRVLSTGGEGEYVLEVGGYTGSTAPFVVTRSDPTDGDIFAAAPVQMVVEFSDPVLVTSLDADDLMLDGSTPATGFSLLDSRTVAFDLPALSEGVHDFEIAVGVVESIHGDALDAACTGSFEIDLTAPRVTASSIQDGETRTDIVGSLSYLVEFDEDVRTDTLDAGDWSLSGATFGPVGVDSWSYDSATHALTIDFGALDEDNYTLTLFSGDGMLEDLVGNDLDGETDPGDWPIPPGQSGDGTAGGDFVVTFTVDIDVAPAPMFQSVPPPGSMIYNAPPLNGRIWPLGDTDSFTVDLDAGQTLTVLVAPADVGLQPTIDVRFGATSVASATAIRQGRTALVQTCTVDQAGTYTIVVGGEPAYATGVYTLAALVLNAALEEENHLATGADDNASTAQDVERSFITLDPLDGNAERGAVVGTLGTRYVYREDFESGLGGWTVDNTFGSGGGLWHPSTGRGEDIGHTLNQSVYYGQNEGASGGGDYDTGSANGGAMISPQIELPSGVPLFVEFSHFLETQGSTVVDIAEVAVQIDGETDWTTILSSTDGSLSLTGGSWAGVSRNVGAYAGETVRFRLSFDTVGATSNAYEGWYVDDFAVRAGGVDVDCYSFSLAAGESITAVATRFGAGALNVSILDATGAVLATGQDGYSNVSSVVDHFVAPTDGTYCARASGTGGAPTYSLVLTRGAAFDLERNDSFASAQPLHARRNALGYVAAGNGLVADYFVNPALLGDPVLTRTDPTVSFNWGGGSPDPLVPSNNFSVRWSGYVQPLYSEQYTFYPLTDDGVRLWVDGQLLVNDWSGHPPTEFSGSLTLEAGRMYSLTMEYYEAGGGAMAELRWSSASTPKEIIPQDRFSVVAEPDCYRVNLGGSMSVSTMTPMDGPGSFDNTLDPMIEVYNSAGTLVASDDNSAADGKNASLSVGGSGIYYVLVKPSAAVTATQGEYVLRVTGALLPEAFTVVDTDPAHGVTIPDIPTWVAVTFDEDVLPTTYDPAMLTVDGSPATAVEILALDTVRYGLPEIGAGSHSLRLAQGAVMSIHGTPVTAYEWGFSVLGPRVISSSVQEGDVVTPGALLIRISFSVDLDAAALDETDVLLEGTETGLHAPTWINYVAGTRTFEVFYSILPEDSYTLTLLSGDGMFEGASGLDLDGEPLNWPIPPNVSGDREPGGDFVVNFTVEPAPAPLPDLIVSSVTADPAIADVGDVVVFSVVVENVGTAPAGPFNVGFWSDRDTAPAITDSPEQDRDVAGLGVGASLMIQFEITVKSERDQTAWAYADRAYGTGEVVESDESNNFGSESGTDWDVVPRFVTPFMGGCSADTEGGGGSAWLLTCLAALAAAVWLVFLSGPRRCPPTRRTRRVGSAGSDGTANRLASFGETGGPRRCPHHAARKRAAAPARSSLPVSLLLALVLAGCSGASLSQVTTGPARASSIVSREVMTGPADAVPAPLDIMGGALSSAEGEVAETPASTPTPAAPAPVEPSPAPTPLPPAEPLPPPAEPVPPPAPAPSPPTFEPSPSAWTGRPGSFGARAGLLACLWPSLGEYDPTYSVGAYYGGTLESFLGRMDRPFEFGVDLAPVNSGDNDTETLFLVLRLDVLFERQLSTPVWYLVAGYHGISSFTRPQDSGADYVGEMVSGIGLGFGAHGVEGGWDVRLSMTPLLGSSNIKSLAQLLFGYHF